MLGPLDSDDFTSELALTPPQVPFDPDSPPFHLTMADSIGHSDLEQLVQDITELNKKLPPTIREGSKQDKLYEVMTKIDSETAWATFNRRFDILFAEDCRDENGRLHHIRRGRFGMNTVINYLNRIIVNEDQLKGFYAPAAIKLERVKTELEYLSL